MALTKRRGFAEARSDQSDTSETELLTKDEPTPSETPKAGSGHGESFCTAKHAILRSLAAVYAVAFLAAWQQNGALIGEKGLMPAKPAFDRERAAATSALDGFMGKPSLFWWVPMDDAGLDGVSAAGLGLSLLVLLGLHSSVAMLALWLLYFTVVSAAEGSSFYAYGWESQLLETGFLAIFLPLLAPRAADPSRCVLWLFRWLSFRISLGAGLIKIRGGSCWEARTCLHYHFETQPVPSPASFVFHFLPKWLLSHAVDLDLFVQLYTSWLVLLPGVIQPLRWVRRGAGLLQITFMLNIAASGNFSFLNHLTIIPSLACLDDACWPRALRAAPPPPPQSVATSGLRRAARGARRGAELALFGSIMWLSWPVVANLLQLESGQVMNGSFGAFRLVNTYGAFGSVGEARYEPIISVSHDGEVWHELDFPCKPGTVTRRPCFCAPYHFRLDWNIWFIGFKPHRSMLQRRESWLFAFVGRLLTDDPTALGLLDASAATSAAFIDPTDAKRRRPPRLVKVDMYHYTMAEPLWSLGARWWHEPSAPLVWWRRSYEELLIPTMQLDGAGRLARAVKSSSRKAL